MNSSTRKQCITILLLLFLIHTYAQDRVQDHNSSRSNKTASRAQDHNSSRSNKTASKAQPDDWTFGVNSGASFGVRSNESDLFRGNSIATKLFGRYHFGNVGLGFSSGIVPGAISNNSLNKFIVERKFQQAQITKSNPFNSYLLFGPSFRFGNRIMVLGDIQGGMFINNPGAVSIGQTGAVRPLYRFEGAGKNLFPGFSGNISLAYPINSSTRFFINTDYLQSRSSIRLYDPQRGIDVAIDQDRKLKLFTVGLGITKSFGSKREAASGMATGKRDETAGERIITTARQRDINTSGTAATNSGSIGPAVFNHAINTKGTGATNGRIMGNENCGPVTRTVTNPDGTVEELLFACPDDAAMYEERISMNVTVPKQTQGSTFGEKVNAGLHAAGSALAQGNSRGVISGTVSWGSGNSSGIITNQQAVSSVGSLAGSGGGAASASYAATGRTIPPSTSTKGTTATIYTREAGSGMATGKRSTRDHGSGMATGKRQYEAVFNEGTENSCTGCAVTVKLIGHELAHTVQQANGLAQGNPLYNGNGQQGTNPMYENKNRLGTGEDADCDGVEGLTVHLINIMNGAVVADTKTTSCGDFFFANVPAASYVVKVTGGFSKTKSYDVTINNDRKMDMAGEIKAANDHWTIQLNSGNSNTQKAGISTSRSNIRSKAITIIETDLDGNGEFEPTKVLMEFNDGTSRDVTGKSKISVEPGTKKVTVRGWNPEKKQERAPGASLLTEYIITIADLDDGATLTSQYQNGTRKDVRVLSKVSHHPNIVQWIIPVGDADDDVAAEWVVKTRTKSNNSNDRMAGGGMNNDNGGLLTYTKNLPVHIGDIDGDGLSEILAGNNFDATNTHGVSKGSSLPGGALPGGAVISAALMIPGTPIGGIIVKGGKNPGGSFRTTQTNEHGEFEFTGFEKGNYLISAQVNYYLDDETVITITDDENDGMTDRKGWDGTVKGGSKINGDDVDQFNNKSGVQDHNSSRSNKTASIADNNSGSASGGSSNKSGVQDHNSSRSNKSAGIADNDPETTGRSVAGTTAKINTRDYLASLDKLDQLLNGDKTASASAVQTTKQNSRLLRSSLSQLENSLQNTDLLKGAANTTDTNFAILLGSVNKLGSQYTTISNVLKTKHDIAMNSIRNMK